MNKDDIGMSIVVMEVSAVRKAIWVDEIPVRLLR